MNIVVESGSHAMHNWGDIAMLTVAVRRLRALFPDAEIHVLTRAPERVAELGAGAVPRLSGPARRAQGGPARGGVRRAARAIVPPTFIRAASSLLSGREAERRHRDVGELVGEADLLVAAGGGYLNGVFHGKAEHTLDYLDRARAAGVPYALLGQGLGPFHDAALLGRTQAALRGATLLALRERRRSWALAREAGVAEDALVVTGDDAVELALDAVNDDAGTGIGVNLRSTDYAGVGSAVERALGPAVAEACARHDAEPTPLPIKVGASYSDVESIRRVLRHGGVASDGGAALGSLGDLLAATAGCRVVITGSYHAAVFGLATGAPVVAVTGSEYYQDKFLGLADVFGVDGGCVSVSTAEQDLAGALGRAVDRAWEAAPDLRGPLRTAAAELVRASRGAYETLGARSAS